jgi:hypothetical protein
MDINLPPSTGIEKRNQSDGRSLGKHQLVKFDLALFDESVGRSIDLMTQNILPKSNLLPETGRSGAADISAPRRTARPSATAISGRRNVAQLLHVH